MCCLWKKLNSAAATSIGHPRNAKQGKARMSSNYILYRDGDYCKFVYGKTYGVKEELKALGGVWAPGIKQWIFPLTTDLTSLSAVIEVRNAAYNVTRNMYRFCCQKAVLKGDGCFSCKDHGFWVRYGCGLYTGD